MWNLTVANKVKIFCFLLIIYRKYCQRLWMTPVSTFVFRNKFGVQIFWNVWKARQNGLTKNAHPSSHCEVAEIDSWKHLRILLQRIWTQPIYRSHMGLHKTYAKPLQWFLTEFLYYKTIFQTNTTYASCVMLYQDISLCIFHPCMYSNQYFRDTTDYIFHNYFQLRRNFFKGHIGETSN